MVAVPSSNLAMQVAQLPASQENGGDSPICRAVWRMVVPGRYSAVSVRPSSSILTSAAAGRVVGLLWLGRPLGRGEPLDVDLRAPTPLVEQRVLHEVHERCRSAHEVIGTLGVAGELPNVVGPDESVLDVEVVGHGEAVAVCRPAAHRSRTGK